MPPRPDRKFTLKVCDIAIFDRLAYQVLGDYDIVAQLVKQLPQDSVRGGQALQVCNEVMNRVRVLKGLYTRMDSNLPHLSLSLLCCSVACLTEALGAPVCNCWAIS
jgi:hypothetical protein